MNARRKKILIFDVILLVIVAVVLVISMVWSRDIELELGLLYYTSPKGMDPSDIVVLNNSDGIYVSAAEGGSSLSVHFVDVGQGDCAIIEFPDGKTMVIDGGERFNAQKTAIQTFITSTLGASFKYFDYAILTHPDSDHCGSLDYVLNNYPARVVYRPNVEAVGTSSNPYVDPGKSDLTSDATKKNTAVYANVVKAMYDPTVAHDFTPKVFITDPADNSQTIVGGSGDDMYSFEFYSPLSTKYTGDGDWNNYSPIMILSYRGFTYVASGDAEEKNLEEFVKKVKSAASDGVTDKYDEFDDKFCANVIKAGHHGSRNATTTEYLETITSPEFVSNVYCVISCGEGNSYKHPHQEALDRYSGIGVLDENILRTDMLGDITITVRADENGEFKMFYGEKTTAPGNPGKPANRNNLHYSETPSQKPNPGDDTIVPIGDPVLVYREFMGIKLKWSVVAWTGYAVLVVAAVVHVALSGENADSGRGRGHSHKSSGRPRRR